MNEEIGTEAAQFIFWEHINGIFVAVWWQLPAGWLDEILLMIVPDLQGGGDGAEGQDEEQHEGSADAWVPQTALHSQVGAHSTMIDIGKKITFYCLQNVWECRVFFAFAFKVCKKFYYYAKKKFLEKYQYRYKQHRIVCWFQIRWCRLKQMPLEKAIAKELRKFWVFLFFQIF